MEKDKRLFRVCMNMHMYKSHAVRFNHLSVFDNKKIKMMTLKIKLTYFHSLLSQTRFLKCAKQCNLL